MDFDSISVVLLLLRDDRPELDEDASNELQDAHLDYLASLHEAGHLLAAGPVGGESLRGLTLLRVDVDEARRLKEQDPAVRAGVYELEVLPWRVPAGAMSFHRTFFPHSIAEATAGS
jgi:uncharacterized protein YciI